MTISSWGRLVALGVLALLASACSSGNRDRPCKSHASCPTGQHCGENGYCALSCRTDKDCGDGICTSLGQCVTMAVGGRDAAPAPPPSADGKDAGPAEDRDARTVIKARRLLDPERGQILVDRAIVIKGKKIEAIVAEAEAPADGNVIDLGDAVIMPGLFDVHTHLCLELRDSTDPVLQRWTIHLDQIEHGVADRAIQCVVSARAVLRAGFTTVRDLGNASDYADTALRKAITSGLIEGPTVVNAGRIIAPVGGQLPGFAPGRESIVAPEYIEADSPDAVRRAVRENILHGARVIKLVVDPNLYTYSVDEIRAAVEEAHGAGLKVAAHCVSNEGCRRAAEAGVDSAEHGYQLREDVIRLLAAKKVYLVATDSTADMYEQMGLPPKLARKLRADAIKRLSLAYKFGVPLAFGSDGYMPGRIEQAMNNIESYVEAGLPTDEVLRTLTVNAAKLMNMDKARGALQPEMYADIIATCDDPLKDITALRRVQFVMKEGEVVTPEDPVTCP